MMPGSKITASFRIKAGQIWIKSIPYVFIMPFGILFLLFFIAPIMYAFYSSLFVTKHSGLGLSAPVTVFNGLFNINQAFHDPLFYQSLGRMLLFGMVQVPIMLGLALFFALLLDSVTIRLKNLFRMAFFVPYAIPGVIAALLWGYLYNPQLSPIVQFLRTIGWTSFDFLAPHAVLWSMANIVTWEWTGYNMIIIYSALQAIPHELYEAAKIDGSNGFNIARYIKIPLVAPAIVLSGLFSIIGTLQIFNEPATLQYITNSITSSYTPNLYAYTAAFVTNEYNYAAALAVLLAIATFIFSFGLLRITTKQTGA